MYQLSPMDHRNPTSGSDIRSIHLRLCSFKMGYHLTCFRCVPPWSSYVQTLWNHLRRTSRDYCMMTSSMETFSALLALCAGNSPVTDEFPSQWPVMRSFDVFFDLRLNKRLSKQSWGWWFETQSGSLWRHCNGNLSTDLARLIKLRTALDCVPLGKTPVMQVQWY